MTTVTTLNTTRLWLRNAVRENEHIQLWVKFNRSIAESNDRILRHCLNAIPHIFNGHQELFYFISNFASNQQIESMYSTLYDLKINDASTPTKKEEKEDDDDISSHEEDDIIPTNPFKSLPTESITHICSFLDHSAITNLKIQSRSLAIICLEEQRKIGVSVFNGNTLLHNINMNLYDFKRDNFIRTRHNANKRLYSFIEEWVHNYNIPEKNQLTAMFNRYDTKQPFICDLKEKRLNTMSAISNRRFLILDNRKIIVLTKRKARKFDINTDSLSKLADYKLVILEYFDVLQQKCNIVQFLLCHESMTHLNILDYIEHKFIYIDHIKWHKELLFILKQMNYNALCPKLCIYQHIDSYHGLRLIEDSSVNQVLSKYSGFTVQLNPKHRWLKTTDKLSKIIAVCALRMDAFHISAKEFCRNVVNAPILYKGNKESLIKAVEKYYESTFDEEERDIFDEDLQSTLSTIRGFNGYLQRIRTMKSSLSGSGRIKIAHLFENIIKPNNIELFDYSYSRRKPWDHELGYDIRFSVVLYDTKEFKIDPQNEKLFQIKVHALDEGAYPFKLRCDDNKVFTFKYKKNFKAKTFINDMFTMIESADGHLLRYEYDEILDIYFEDRKKLLRNKNIECVLTEGNDDYFGGKLEILRSFAMNDMYVSAKDRHIWDSEKIKKLNLFMIQTQIDDNKKKYKLKIKFVSNINEKFTAKTPIKKLKTMQWVGMPLIAWINKEDSLQKIINRYLDEDTKKVLQFTYRVIADDKIVSIAKSKRNKYRPYHELYDEDYIVLLMPKSKTEGCQLQVYSASVHKALHF